MRQDTQGPDSAALTDEQARAQAVDPTRSVILQAPAGSGKTSVLIERLLVLLTRAESPEEILAITFTRKAAAEMSQRVADLLQPTPPAPRTPRDHRQQALARSVLARSQLRGWRLEENPARLRIQTLDALNRALALQMPLAARGNGGQGVLLQPDSAYRTAARRALLDAQSDPVLEPDVQLLFERMENDFGRCERLIAGMLARRTHWLPYLVADAASQLVARITKSLTTVVQSRLARAQLLLAQKLPEGVAIAQRCAGHLQSQGAEAGPWSAFCVPVGVQDLELAHWHALAALALTQSATWRKRLDVRGGFPPTDADLKRRGLQWIAELAAEPGALALLTEIQLLPEPRLGADETQVLGVLARLLRLAVAELDLVFQEWGRVDYPAIAAAARLALGSVDDPTELALRLDNRIRHILVDEFQDTSLEQTQLLGALTAGWMPEDGRTLFLVGDPMQSIYGFREAEVGMFLAARDYGIGSVPLQSLKLTCNFRSTAAVVEWNNRIFSASFPEVDDPRTSSVAYAPSDTSPTGLAPGQVRLHRVLPGDYAGEASSIAEVITQLRTATSAPSIAVLVSSRAHAAPIVAALAARDIPVSGVDLVPLGDLSIVRDLTALTRALDHLADRTAWLTVLRAPWCGLTLEEIGGLLGTQRAVTVWQQLIDPEVLATLPPGAQQRLRRVREALEPGGEDLARRVETAWLRLGGPAACEHEADLGHARAFFDALAQWSQEPDWGGPLELPERLKRLHAAHAAEARGAVEIMTIHRAKGLEFDHVILPGLGRPRRHNDRALLQWLDLPNDTGGSDLLMVAVPPAAASEPTALGRYVTRLQDQRNRNEATRLLYVAATRARFQLHLYGQIEDPTEGKSEPSPRAGTLLERLWPAIREEFPLQAEGSADLLVAPRSQDAARPYALERLRVDWQPPAWPLLPQPQVVPIASYEPPQTDAGDPVERAVCELLRSCARRRRLPAAGETDLSVQLEQRLRLAGVATAALSADTLAALDLLQACLQDSRLHWIFAGLAAADGSAEVPLALTGMFEGRLTNSRADLSFLDRTGTRWLIDIAPQPRPGETLEAAFAVRLARHVELGTALQEAPTRAAVYLPATQLWLEGPL